MADRPGMVPPFSTVGVSMVPAYEGHSCRVCGGPHPVRYCPELRYAARGRECILDGPVFDAIQSILSVVYKDDCELIVVEVKLRQRENQCG